jgi:hypothetical protein
LDSCSHQYDGTAPVSDADCLQVVEEYKGHDSIAYGADWYKGVLPTTAAAAAAAATNAACDGSDNCDKLQNNQVSLAAAAAAEVAAQQLEGMHLRRDTEAAKQRQAQRLDVVATCSFYDRRLHLWSPKTDCSAALL